MAAFYLYKRSDKVDKKSIVEHFETIGISNYSEFELGNMNLILFRKQYVEIANFAKNAIASIYVAGSFVYKEFNYQQSINKLLDDYTNGTIDVEEIRGNYVVIIFDKVSKGITFITDPLFTKNIYCDFKSEIISSNFMSIVESKPFYYKINSLALAESVISGSLIAPDTYAHGVEKLCKANFKKLREVFGFCTIQVDISNKRINFASFSDAVDHANEQLKKYFKCFISMDHEFSSHVGLTGGFDSRLLLIHARQHLKNLNTNSFYRPDSLEYKIAKQLAASVGKEFLSHEYAQNIPTANSNRSFRFLDGQIRSQNFFAEPFNLPEYGAYLYKNHLIGFHGCGGEQYRNADRFKRKIGFSDFLKYEWLYRVSGKVVINRKFENDLLRNIDSKIRAILDFKGDKVDLFLLKRIQNEIWNPSNRLTRVNALNLQFLYFAPFTEWQQSVYAYSYCDFLGVNADFQIEMMKRYGKDELNVFTTYGFNIIEGQSLKSKRISNIASNMPRKLLLDLHKLYRRDKRKINPLKYDKNEAFDNLHNSIDVPKVLCNVETSHNLTAISTLRSQLKLVF